MNEKKRLEEMGANQPSSPYFKQYQTILEMIKRNQGGSIIKSKSMNQFLNKLLSKFCREMLQSVYHLMMFKLVIHLAIKMYI